MVGMYIECGIGSSPAPICELANLGNHDSIVRVSCWKNTKARQSAPELAHIARNRLHDLDPWFVSNWVSYLPLPWCLFVPVHSNVHVAIVNDTRVLAKRIGLRASTERRGH